MLEQKTRPLEFLSIPKLSPKPNFHPEIELVVCKRGVCNAYVNGECHCLTENTAIIVFPYQIHFYDTAQNGEFELFIFYPEITPQISELYSSSIPSKPLVDLSKEQVRLIDKFCKAYDKTESFASTTLTGFINVIMADILPLVKLAQTSSDRNLVDEIIRYCTKKFNEPLSLDILAQEFKTSTSNISHAWGKVMNLSIPQYINWLRISTACRLLATTDRTVTTIAYEVGFTTLRNFNRMFLKTMHTTPIQYREQHRVR
jgi:AraC-like DNA-binding protein